METAGMSAAARSRARPPRKLAVEILDDEPDDGGMLDDDDTPDALRESLHDLEEAGLS